MLMTHCVLQVIEELLSDPTDQTNLYLMYASHTTDDIMWVARGCLKQASTMPEAYCFFGAPAGQMRWFQYLGAPRW
jgi:hypothetical protein